MTAFHRMKDLPWEQVNELLDRKVVSGELMTMTRYRFSKGGRFPEHFHEQEQATSVLSGSLTFVVEGRRYLLGPDDVILVPPGEVHAAVAGEGGAEVLSIVSPARSGVNDFTLLKDDR